ncbi:hypothetical protein K458DRAFT_33888 [Lentithecium fluviatile CBS 122367]|uniref:Uncharacterized protein n=1 Tax=Lentithecium fluviatile CBS 122367 TaxID=1168545 RepID=A0A6G1J2Z3_9PLEO|nr:hypothetical protein K458DRAFT_33888 [Lentithecium fluviatile CBS 122367]
MQFEASHVEQGGACIRKSLTRQVASVEKDDMRGACDEDDKAACGMCPPPTAPRRERPADLAKGRLFSPRTIGQRPSLLRSPLRSGFGCLRGSEPTDSSSLYSESVGSYLMPLLYPSNFAGAKLLFVQQSTAFVGRLFPWSASSNVSGRVPYSARLNELSLAT